MALDQTQDNPETSDLETTSTQESVSAEVTTSPYPVALTEVSVVIPALNEEVSVSQTVTDILQTLKLVIL